MLYFRLVEIHARAAHKTTLPCFDCSAAGIDTLETWL